MKTLILVHCEDTFRKFFPQGFIATLRRKMPNYHVIHCTSQVNDDHPIQEIADLVDREIDWGWGYEREMFDGNERRFVIPSLGHDWTWVPPELRALPKRAVCLGGGSCQECLLDMESVLEHLRIPYRKLKGIVY